MVWAPLSDAEGEFSPLLTAYLDSQKQTDKQKKRDATKAKITCAVSIGPRDGGGFGIAVKLRVEDKSLPQSDLAAFAKQAHEQICPYSHATRNNVDVHLEVVGD